MKDMDLEIGRVIAYYTAGSGRRHAASLYVCLSYYTVGEFQYYLLMDPAGQIFSYNYDSLAKKSLSSSKLI